MQIAPPTAAESAYVKSTVATDGTIQMQTSATCLVATNKPDIWLVGAVHIGTAPYYGLLQGLLNGQEAVLYEGVRPGKATPVQPPSTDSTAVPVYKSLSDALGLEFQQNRIDYKRSGWRNVDLSWDDMDRIDKEVGGDKPTGYGAVKGLLDPNSDTAKMLATALKLATPGMKEAIKIMLVKSPGSGGLKPEAEAVILDARNKHLLMEIEKILDSPTPPKSLGVLYGAAHLVAVEKDLVTKYGYRIGEKRWFVSATADPSKLDAMGRSLLDSFEKNAAMKPPR